MTKKIIYVASAAIIDADNRILIQQRPEGKSYAGFWEFPGGKLDPGETPEQALVRELHEELGIETLEKALFPLTFFSGEYAEYHVVNVIFGCRNWVGVPSPREGQQGLAWVKAPRLTEYNLLKKNHEVVSVLCQLI
jgi:8-oxo-dGTP diphosphatase